MCEHMYSYYLCTWLFPINCVGLVDQIGTLSVGGQSDLLSAGRRPPAWARWARAADGARGPHGHPRALMDPKNGTSYVGDQSDFPSVRQPAARRRAHAPHGTQLYLFGPDPQTLHFELRIRAIVLLSSFILWSDFRLG